MQAAPGRNIKGTAVRSHPVPTAATRNSSARAGGRTGPLWSFYLFLNPLGSAPKQVQWEFFRFVFWHQSQKQVKEHVNFLQLFEKAGKEAGGVNWENWWKWWVGSCTELSLLSPPGSVVTLSIAQMFAELDNTNFVCSASPSFSKAWIYWVNTADPKNL